MQRRRLPPTRHSLTTKIQSCGTKVYVTVGFFDDGTPGEVFVKLPKQGSDLSGFCNGWATTTSLLLQNGVPWEEIESKFVGSRFGANATPEDPSILDGIARAVTRLIQSRKEKGTL